LPKTRRRPCTDLEENPLRSAKPKDAEPSPFSSDAVRLPGNNLDRFGWSSGQLSYFDENGNEVRICEIMREDQKMIDKLKAERQLRDKR
jgi:hypothetical protein